VIIVLPGDLFMVFPAAELWEMLVQCENKTFRSFFGGKRFAADRLLYIIVPRGAIKKRLDIMANWRLWMNGE
jgi:hypothetical protein